MAHAKVSRSTKPNQQSEVKQDPLTLGEHIAAVLAHPDTPKRLYDAIVNELSELQSNKIVDTPEFIQMVLDLNKKYVDPEQEGGAS